MVVSESAYLNQQNLSKHVECQDGFYANQTRFKDETEKSKTEILMANVLRSAVMLHDCGVYVRGSFVR